jgi:ornithine cyclodeaminase/alanine dehydrogenase-like protein (mu-crystallin family)
MKTLVLSNDEVLDLLSMKDCIALMREALLALAKGEVHQPLRTVIKPAGAKGVMGLMPAYMSTPASYGLKAICVFPGNPEKGLDSHQGAVQLFSGETGELLAIMNASAITAIRTAAVSGVATDVLARKGACDLAILGAGVQARSHLLAMSHVRSIKRCRISSRRIEHARNFVDEMRRQVSLPIEAVETVEEALDGADLIVTATNSREPIVRREWVAAGSHLNVVGSSSRKAREVDTAMMAAASLFVDSRESTVNEAGDYLIAVSEGAIGSDHIRAEVGEVLNGDKPGRRSPEEITLFKSLGLAAEDLFAAEYLFRKAKETNVGTWVTF